jgi:aryl-alcohol dehydrogenase-like predicted oxidoreductase
MEQRELGRSGIHVSEVGLGCNNFGMFQDAEQAIACVHEALDSGITLFDMASEHGSGIEEQLVGTALRGHRDEVVIATKVGQAELLRITSGGHPDISTDLQRCGLSRRWILRSVEESLTRLRTDYIDVYQPHIYDPLVPREETVATFDDLIQQGKIRAIGEAATANSCAQLIATCELTTARKLTGFCSVQAHYNLLARDVETELIAELERQGMSLIPYFPLANGLLTGKYVNRDQYPEGSRFDRISIIRGMVGDDDWNTLDALAKFAVDRGMSMTHLAISWLLTKPVVASVIAGASRPEQIRDNVAAVGVSLTSADLAELDIITSRR